MYCGIERCYFEVAIDRGLFRYQLSKHLVTTDSARNASPCPPDLGKTMDSIRQSTMRSGRMLSSRASSTIPAHTDLATSSHEAASASVHASPPAGVGHTGFSAPLGVSPVSHEHDASERNGASGCSLSDDLQQVTGQAQTPAERAAAMTLDEAVHSKAEQPGTAGYDSGLNRSLLVSQSTPPRISGSSSAHGADGASLGPLWADVSATTLQCFSPAPATPPLDDRDVSTGRTGEEGSAPLSASGRRGSLRTSQRTPGLLSQELRKVCPLPGVPPLILGDLQGGSQSQGSPVCSTATIQIRR